jgi:hypothetical protein
VRGKRCIDLRVDPPPDLAIEIDITRSSLDRLSIYADLGLPEIWRLDEQGVTFHILQPDGQYATSERSLAFPLLTSSDVGRFAALRGQMDENAVIREFRAWMQQSRSGNGPTQSTP